MSWLHLEDHATWVNLDRIDTLVVTSRQGTKATVKLWAGKQWWEGEVAIAALAGAVGVAPPNIDARPPDPTHTNPNRKRP